MGKIFLHKKAAPSKLQLTPWPPLSFLLCLYVYIVLCLLTRPTAEEYISYFTCEDCSFLLRIFCKLKDSKPLLINWYQFKCFQWLQMSLKLSSLWVVFEFPSSFLWVSFQYSYSLSNCLWVVFKSSESRLWVVFESSLSHLCTVERHVKYMNI